MVATPNASPSLLNTSLAHYIRPKTPFHKVTFQAMQLSQNPALLWVIIIVGVATFLSIVLYVICTYYAGYPSLGLKDEVAGEPEDDGGYRRRSFDSAHSQSPPSYHTLWSRSDPCTLWLADSVGTQNSCNEHGAGVQSNYDNTEQSADLSTITIWLRTHCLSPPPAVMTRFRSVDGLLIESRQERASIV